MKAYAIPRPETAFSLSPGKKKRPRERLIGHLDWIRKRPCLVCLTHAKIHAAHLRSAYPQFGKRETGIGEKPDDSWTVPLCSEHHTDGPDAQHKGNEMEFWAHHGINPFMVALALFRASGDDDAGDLIIQSVVRQG